MDIIKLEAREENAVENTSRMSVKECEFIQVDSLRKCFC